MALIKCPECGKEISDKAENCIHCGYPIASLDKEKYATDQYTVILESPGVNRVKIIKIVREITGIDLKAAKEAVENVPYIITDKVSLEDATAVKNKFDGEGAIVSMVSSDNKNIKIATTESNSMSSLWLYTNNNGATWIFHLDWIHRRKQNCESLR